MSSVEFTKNQAFSRSLFQSPENQSNSQDLHARIRAVRHKYNWSIRTDLAEETGESAMMESHECALLRSRGFAHMAGP